MSSAVIMAPSLSAAVRVLSTVELLGQILLEVAADSKSPVKGLKSLLRTQEVNKDFEATIASSIKLKQCLWLAPSTTSNIRVNPIFAAPRDTRSTSVHCTFRTVSSYKDLPLEARVDLEESIFDQTVPGSWKEMTICTEAVLFYVRIRNSMVAVEGHAFMTAGELAEEVAKKIRKQEFSSTLMVRLRAAGNKVLSVEARPRRRYGDFRSYYIAN